MRNHDKEPEQSPVYEAVLPEWRFKELAKQVFIRHANEVTRTKNTAELTWTDQAQYYKLHCRKDSNPWVEGYQTTYSLDYHENSDPDSQPKLRWRIIEFPSGNLSPFKVIDEQNREMKLDKAAKRSEAAKALQILTAAAPDEARQLLERSMDHKYSLVIGTYVLSNLALEGADPSLDVGAVWYAAQEHEERVAIIEHEELKRAKRRRAKKYPQPYYYEAVQEAVETRPASSGPDRYASLDVLGATDIVATRTGRIWKNIIHAEES